MIKQLTSALCGLMLLTGCAVVGPDYRLTPTELGGEFANASQGGLSSDSIDTTWWCGFKDKELDRLVDLALRANHDRRIASARLREARALWFETSLDRLPDRDRRRILFERAAQHSRHTRDSPYRPRP